MVKSPSQLSKKMTHGPVRCRRKFLRIFPGGFRDETYISWEREYKWETHELWQQMLARDEFRRLLRGRAFDEIAQRALRVEQRSRHPMIFSFEKMALRDAVKWKAGAQAFAEGLYHLLHSPSALNSRFEQWVETMAGLPRRQTRVLTWPIVTVFGFIAQPDVHIFLKPRTMRAAAQAYNFELTYHSRPSWDTYASLLEFADIVGRDLRNLRPRDMIDIQSFLWVQGSDEYR